MCWNCGEKGHFKDKCLKPAVDKKNNIPKKSGTANIVINSDSEGEGAFFMEPDSDSDEDLSDGGCKSDGNETDWFFKINDKAGSSWNTEELSGVDWSECDSPIDVDLDSVVVAAGPDELAALVGVGNVDLPHAEIYDSGCSKHLMPYHDALESFIEIPPKSFPAVNKQNMTAVGMGKMTINVPDGADVSQLKLTEVLYSLEVGYTLVSVGWLDEKGFEIIFSGGKCTIKGPNGEHVGAVPKTKGLYHVAHDEHKMAHAVGEELTLDQFHHDMRHISAGVAHRLVNNGFVTGVHLEPKSSGEPFFCKSCVYVKATRKPVPKAHKGKHATKFGNEVYSDLWGPAPVKMKGGVTIFLLTHIYTVMRSLLQSTLSQLNLILTHPLVPPDLWLSLLDYMISAYLLSLTYQYLYKL